MGKFVGNWRIWLVILLWLMVGAVTTGLIGEGEAGGEGEQHATAVVVRV